jgi:hypothetical protein
VENELAVDIVVVVQSQAQLLQVVLTLRSASGFTSLLNSGQQQSDQDRDNCDHNKQLDQGKPFQSPRLRFWIAHPKSPEMRKRKDVSKLSQ